VQEIKEFFVRISKVFGVGEFKYGNKNLKGAKGVAIATKFRLKNKNASDIMTMFTFMIRFWDCRIQIQICYLNFSESKGRCHHDNQI